MVDSRPTGPARDGRLRTGGPLDGVVQTPVAGQARQLDRFRPRIPTLADLARLMVNGILVLPRNYRRGMFLDILV